MTAESDLRREEILEISRALDRKREKILEISRALDRRREEILEISRTLDRHVVRNELSEALYAVETLRILLITEQLDQERQAMHSERMDYEFKNRPRY